MPAVLTRVGVLRYTDETGREWGELRPPEEVFAPASLDSLRAAPVVDLHPDVPVTTENFQTLSLGHVHDDVAPEDERLVVATLTVNAGPAVKKIDAGERKDVSCGYSMRPDHTPGVWNGEPYDVVQRDIRYNHVGIGPPGWGRAGEEVSLRLDGAAVQVRSDSAPKGKDDVRVIKIKGREYKLDAEGEVVAAQGAVDDMTKKADADATELAAVKESLMNSLTLVAQLEAKLAAASATKPVVTEEMVPDEVADSIARKRTDLHQRARRVLGDKEGDGKPLKLDGLSVAEIHRRTVAKARPEIKLDGLSTDTLAGMFLAVTSEGAASTARNDGLASAHRAAHGDDTNLRTDGDDDLDPAAELNRNTQNTFERRSRGDKEGGR